MIIVRKKHRIKAVRYPNRCSKSSQSELDNNCKAVVPFVLLEGEPKRKHRIKAVLHFGSPNWARTSDIMINSHALYRLSYRGILFLFPSVRKQTTLHIFEGVKVAGISFQISTENRIKT